jgi:hypothetical protein
MEKYSLLPRPTGLPSARGWKLNQMLSGGADLNAAEMGPRLALSSMLRFTPDDGGAAWVRAHAAAAVGNLASHPRDALGEDSLKGTFRRKLIDAGIFEDVLSAATHKSFDPSADAKCVEASTATLMLLAGEGHVLDRETMSYFLEFIEGEAGDVRAQQFLMGALWLLLRDPVNRATALGVMMPADEAEESAKAEAAKAARAAARETRDKARAVRAEAAKWGLYELHAVDLTNSVKVPGFQPSSPCSEKLVSKFAASNATCTAMSRCAEEAGEMPPPPEEGEGEGDAEAGLYKSNSVYP